MRFIRHCRPWFKPARHHEVICEHLEAVERGEIDRLMIFAPPRHSKSELVSRCFPAWYLGRHPRRSVIATAYGGELGGDVGADVRGIVRDELYAQVFPGVTLTDDEKARTRWSVTYRGEDGRDTQGGRYIAAGVGGQIVGRGGHLLLLDDVIKSREEASSKHMRDLTYRWYQSDLYTRQSMDGAAIVLVLTRWDVDDLGGRLLEDAQAGGDQWTVLSLPAIAGEGDALGRAPGEALWPEFFPVERLERIRKALSVREGPRAWEALYQQRPTEPTGSYFRRDWIEPYMYPLGQHPEGMRIYGASDYAITAGGGNWTVHVVVGIDGRQHVWLLDLWRQQTGPLEWCEAWVDLVKRWQPMYWAEEVGQIRKSVGPLLDRLMRERDAYTVRSSEDGQYVPSTSKGSRARSIAGRMQMGMVHIPSDAPWTSALMEELLGFTGEGDSTDDQVDALALIGLALGELEGESPVPVELKRPWDYDARGERRREAVERVERGTWRPLGADYSRQDWRTAGFPTLTVGDDDDEGDGDGDDEDGE